MGLIKAALGAAGGVLGDQWKEYFYCEAMDANTLVAKGEKRTSKRSSNKHGEENIISNGSIVAVNEGQCMMIVEQGKIVEIASETGEYTYDTSTEPSIFCGNLGESLMESFKTLGKRFTFGGDTAKDQRVYFFNTKEIMGNKYGTPNAIPFKIQDDSINLKLTVSLRCHGEYSYKITNPMLFYKNVCGNVENTYERSQLDSQMKTELLTALQPAFGKISLSGVDYTEITLHTMEIADNLNDILSAKWRDLRGIEIISFGISSVTASEEDEQRIKTLQNNAVFRDPTMAAAQMVGAQSQAMMDAAKNEGGLGAMGGFFGMNMAQNAGGLNAQSLFAMGQQQAAQAQQAAAQPQPQQAAAAPAGGWTCKCGAVNTGKFCVECGTPKPAEDGWTCSCGAVNKGKFCQECGSPKPAGAPLYKCDKCGWEPEDPHNPPKFCPECGDVFDENDIQK